MDYWEKFNEQHYLEEKNFIDITGADYMHAERVCTDFEIKHIAHEGSFWLPSGYKTRYRFLVTSGCLLSREV